MAVTRHLAYLSLLAMISSTKAADGCDSALWTDKRGARNEGGTCPRPCMAVFSASKYKTCRNYCAEQQVKNGGGLDCVGAWDDKDNQCTDAGGDETVTAPAGKTTCDFDFAALGTSDGVCECKAPAAGSTPIVADKAQMGAKVAKVSCGDSTVDTHGQTCTAKDDDALLQTASGIAMGCVKWVASGMPEVQDAGPKGKGCNHCVGAGTVACILCPTSCAAAAAAAADAGTSAGANTTANAATAQHSLAQFGSAIMTMAFLALVF